MAKLSEVAVIMRRMSETYGMTLSEDQVRGYHTVLGDFPRMVLVRASVECMKKNKFFPRPAEVIHEAMQEMKTYKQPEWARVDEACKWFLYVNNLNSSDELTDAQVKAIYASAGVTMIGG